MLNTDNTSNNQTNPKKQKRIFQSKNQSKKTPKNFLLLYRILKYIQKGTRLSTHKTYSSAIARQLNISKQKCKYYVNIAENKEFVKRNFRTTFVDYSITKKGIEYLRLIDNRQSSPKVKTFSLPMKKSIRSHNLSIKFPIITDNPDFTYDKETRLNNWIKKYKILHFPIGITIEKTTKHIIADFHTFITEPDIFLTDFYNYVFRGILYLSSYLKENKIIIDVYDMEIIKVKRNHIANEEPEYDEILQKKALFERSLGRKAKCIYKSDEEGKVWIDRSLGMPEIETNDMVYEEKLLAMPEVLFSLATDLKPAIEELTNQINLHLDVQRKQREVQKETFFAVKDLRNGIKEFVEVIQKEKPLSHLIRKGKKISKDQKTLDGFENGQ